jgi:hypothetical protein
MRVSVRAYPAIACTMDLRRQSGSEELGPHELSEARTSFRAHGRGRADLGFDTGRGDTILSSHFAVKPKMYFVMQVLTLKFCADYSDQETPPNWRR